MSPSDASPPFGKVPSDVVMSGLLADLSRCEALVYLAICACADGRTGQAMVGNEALRRCSGMSRRAVQMAVKRLSSKWHLIELRPGGGRHQANQFRVIREAAVVEKRRTGHCAVSSDKGRTPDAETAQNPDKKQRNSYCAPSENDQKSEEEEELIAISAELSRMGIGQPVRGQLAAAAAAAGLAASQVGQSLAKVDGPPGWRVTALRAMISEAAAAAAQDAKLRDQAERQRRQDDEQRRRWHDSALTGDEWRSALDQLKRRAGLG